MTVNFDEAVRSVQGDWPDYRVAEYGYESDDHWFLVLLPETTGGRIPAVAKDTGAVTWINENAEIYTQENPVGSHPR